MKYFDFRILINDEDTKKARQWCREYFGKLEVIYLTVKCKRQNKNRTESIGSYNRYIGIVYDVEKNTWYNKVTANPCAFYFKNENDAMAFKLRWI